MKKHQKTQHRQFKYWLYYITKNILLPIIVIFTTTTCTREWDNPYDELGNNKGTGTVTDYDGNTYKTVTIGTQKWMAENLKVTHYPNGNTIPLVTDNTAWGNLGDKDTDDAYCYYDNSNTNRDTYGALYTYAAAKDACPTGWHLPSDEEWKTLEIYLGMSSSDADSLSYDAEWNYYQRGSNEGSKLAGNSELWVEGELKDDIGFGTSGFIARPGGGRYYSGGSFRTVGSGGDWWSSTESNSSYAYHRYLYYYDSGVYRYYYYKSNGFSVRCVRDN